MRKFGNSVAALSRLIDFTAFLCEMHNHPILPFELLKLPLPTPQKRAILLMLERCVRPLVRNSQKETFLARCTRALSSIASPRVR